MALFRYKAAGADGNAIEGHLEAADQAMVLDRLRAQGLLPIRIEEALTQETPSSRTQPGPRLRLPQRTQVTRGQLIAFSRELATLLKAGLPLDRALEILLSLADSPVLQQCVAQLRDDVRGGMPLSEAMGRQPLVFGRFYVSMVRAGEAGGALAMVLQRITEYLERSQELRESVSSALIYPAILLLVAVVSVLLLLIFVVPQFAQMFEESGKALPLPTQIVMSAGELLKTYWWTLILAAIAVERFFHWQMSDSQRRRPWDRRLLALPMLGDLIAKVEVARLARTLSTLLGNGVALLAALGIVRDTVSNTLVADSLTHALERLKSGQGFARPLMERGVFPPLAIHMIRVGEETGQLEAMLTRVADVFDREVQLAVRRLLALVEPVMILGLGLLIGGIILSILIAILRVNSLAT